MDQAQHKRRQKFCKAHGISLMRDARGSWPADLVCEAWVTTRPKALKYCLGAEPFFLKRDPRGGEDETWQGYVVHMSGPRYGDGGKILAIIPWTGAGGQIEETWDSEDKRSIRICSHNEGVAQLFRAMLPGLKHVVDWWPRKFTEREIQEIIRKQLESLTLSAS